MTNDGKEAILDISAGDMRKVFNILQVISFPFAHRQSASASFQVIDEAAVCQCCGVPNSMQIRNLLEKLLNSDYCVSYSCTSPSSHCNHRLTCHDTRERILHFRYRQGAF